MRSDLVPIKRTKEELEAICSNLTQDAYGNNFCGYCGNTAVTPYFCIMYDCDSRNRRPGRSTRNMFY